MSGAIGFVGPLEEVDQDERCPLCGLDPEDPTLHAPTCPTVTDGLCGVIRAGRMCMKPDHAPVPPRPGTDDGWDRWRNEHEWTDFTALAGAGEVGEDG